MLLSAVSVLVVVQSSSEIPEGLMNNPVYRLLLGRKISENLSKIPLFGPSLIHQLRLLGSQQHPQIGVHDV